MKTTIFSFLILACPLVSFASHGLVPCGLNGSIQERIQDCSEKHPGKQKWKKNFNLVKRNRDLQGIFQDKKTGLIWGASLGKMSFEKASKICSDSRLDQNIDLPGLKWRLPSVLEFKVAAKNNIVEILAPTPVRRSADDLGILRHHGLWTSTVTKSFNDGFKVISVFTTWNENVKEGYNRGESYVTRCVARQQL